MNEFCFLLRGRRRHKCLCSFEQQQQWTERETFRGVGGVDYTDFEVDYTDFENFDLILLLKFCGGGGGTSSPPSPFRGFLVVVFSPPSPSPTLPHPPPPKKKERGKGGGGGMEKGEGGKPGNGSGQI